MNLAFSETLNIILTEGIVKFKEKLSATNPGVASKSISFVLLTGTVERLADTQELKQMRLVNF